MAFDTPKGEGCKAYGVYDSATEYTEAMLENRPHCYAYEVIQKSRPARFYLDVEFLSTESENGYPTLIALIDFFKAKIAAAYPAASTECLVACATRPANNTIKHSYHLLWPGLLWHAAARTLKAPPLVYIAGGAPSLVYACL